MCLVLATCCICIVTRLVLLICLTAAYSLLTDVQSAVGKRFALSVLACLYVRVCVCLSVFAAQDVGEV